MYAENTLALNSNVEQCVCLNRNHWIFISKDTLGFDYMLREAGFGDICIHWSIDDEVGYKLTCFDCNVPDCMVALK